MVTYIIPSIHHYSSSPSYGFLSSPNSHEDGLTKLLIQLYSGIQKKRDYYGLVMVSPKVDFQYILISEEWTTSLQRCLLLRGSQ